MACGMWHGACGTEHVRRSHVPDAYASEVRVRVLAALLCCELLGLWYLRIRGSFDTLVQILA